MNIDIRVFDNRKLSFSLRDQSKIAYCSILLLFLSYLSADDLHIELLLEFI